MGLRIPTLITDAMKRFSDWYSHGMVTLERCVLVGELTEKYIYEPFQTWPDTEMIDNNGNN